MLKMKKQNSKNKLKEFRGKIKQSTVTKSPVD